MVKYVFNRVKCCMPAALVMIGWLSFLLGVCMDAPSSLKVMLLSVARVLP